MLSKFLKNRQAKKISTKKPTIGVIALSGGVEPSDAAKRKASEDFFASLGCDVLYGEHLKPTAKPLDTPLVEQRLHDFYNMLSDSSVRAIWAYAGGDNANQILSELDFSVIKAQAKSLFGHSDNTSIINAIYNKTGVMGYYAPNFRAVGKKHGQDFTQEHLKKILKPAGPFTITASKQWFDKDYSKPNAKTTAHKNSGWWVLGQAIGAGTIIGGEISTLNLLHGTPWAPNYKDKVLFTEMFMGNLAEFDRLLTSILQQPGGDNLEALLIGRFQKAAKVSRSDLEAVLKRKPQLQGVPIIANVDFGHTQPMVTLPIGGSCLVRTTKSETLIRIEEH